MKASYVVPLAVFSTLVLFSIVETDAAAPPPLQCYVCQDCAETFSSEHLQNCTKRETKCVKMTLLSGDVDRMCAERGRCDGRSGKGGRSKRSIDDQIDDCLPKRRTVRQLLGGDGGGGGSSSSSSSANKNKNKKEKEKQKDEKAGTKEALEIHCCAGDGCNGALGLSSISVSPLFLTSFLLLTLFPSLRFPVV